MTVEARASKTAAGGKLEDPEGRCSKGKLRTQARSVVTHEEHVTVPLSSILRYFVRDLGRVGITDHGNRNRYFTETHFRTLFFGSDDVPRVI